MKKTKPNFLKNYFASFLCFIASAALLLLSGCPAPAESPPTAACSEADSDFNKLVKALFVKNTATEKKTWDLPIHFYTFKDLQKSKSGTISILKID